MKNHLISWDLRRIICLVGIFFILLTVKDEVWLMGFIGIYYAGMTFFKSGCASGNCEVILLKKINFY